MDERGFFSFRTAWAIPAMAIFTLALGTWGWMSHGLQFDDALYRSVALFDIGNDAYSHAEGLQDWRFRIGRWTGLVVVFSAAILALGTLLQQRVTTAVARWTKQAVVVIGGDSLATAAFEAARRARRSSLWLGANAFGSAGLGSIALPWPPQDRSQTVADHSGKADHILVANDDDAEALALVRAARTAASEAYITVLMRDVRLAEEAGATLNEARTRVLSQAAVAARALNLAHPPFLIAKELGHERIHALIIGFGQTGQAIARDMIVNCRTTYLELPRITVIDPQAKALEGVLRVRAPEIDACVQSLFIEGEIGGRAVSPDPTKLARAVAEAGPITAAYVCLATDVDGLSAAAMLQSLLRAVDLTGPPIFVRLRELNTVAGDSGTGLDALTPFGDLASILDASEFLSNAPDEAARAFQEAYRASLPAEQREDQANRAAFSWDSLDETYRQIIRDAVAHIPAKLASAGAPPVFWRGVTGVPQLAPGERLFATADKLEALARLEHERWMAQRRMDGWRWTDRPRKDEARRLHPSLKAYDELTEQDKEYDRVYVRQTQMACGGPPA
ncbi:MAG: RyR domain-containing protein [Caulobacterales bacterium]